MGIPPVALELRRVINLARVVQSHALSFFHLSSPDLLFGFDADPAQRNLFAAASEAPQLARDGIALRRFSQRIIEILGGKRIHPSWVVPGGVSHPLAADQRDEILATVAEALAAARRGLAWYRERLGDFADEAVGFANFPTLSMGLVHETGNAGYSDGDLRVVDATGTVLADRIDPRPYWEYLGERVEPWSYLKSTYWKALGYPEGIYRVGPLARLNVVDRLGTPEADEALGQYRDRWGRYPTGSFHYHEARLIEILHCIAMIDAAAGGEPGTVRRRPLARTADDPSAGLRWSHGLTPATLAELSAGLYGSAPPMEIVTVAGGSFAVCEHLSDAVKPAVVAAAAEAVVAAIELRGVGPVPGRNRLRARPL